MTEYQDYKYVMQDAGNLYLGAKYTYAELLANEDVPFKLKSIIHRYISPELDEETSLESHFYYLNEEGFVYQVCRQLKIKIKYSELVEKKTLFGKQKQVYQTKVLKLKNLQPFHLKKKRRWALSFRKSACLKWH